MSEEIKKNITYVLCHNADVVINTENDNEIERIICAEEYLESYSIEDLVKKLIVEYFVLDGQFLRAQENIVHILIDAIQCTLDHLKFDDLSMTGDENGVEYKSNDLMNVLMTINQLEKDSLLEEIEELHNRIDELNSNNSDK